MLTWGMRESHCRFRKTLCLAKILAASITESTLLSVSRYPVPRRSWSFLGIGGSCHEEEESLVSSDVVDFSIVARQRVHYSAGPESGSQGDELV